VNAEPPARALRAAWSWWTHLVVGHPVLAVGLTTVLVLAVAVALWAPGGRHRR
jgi:hypothetical protein